MCSAVILLVALLVWWLVPIRENGAPHPLPQGEAHTSRDVPTLPLPAEVPAQAIGAAAVVAAPHASRQRVLGGGDGPRRPFGIRVIDLRGALVSGATVSLWTRNGETPPADALPEAREGYFARHRNGAVIDPDDDTWERLHGRDPTWTEPDTTATTDAAGRCWMELPEGRVLVAATSGAEWSSGTWCGDAWTRLDPESDLILVLRRTCRLTGQVVDAAGHPAANAVVFPQAHWPGTSSRSPRRPESVRTDDTGRFEFRVEAPGLFQFVAQLGPEWSNMQSVAFRDRDEGPIVLRLGTPCLVTGSVLDAAGRPTPGAKVCAQASDGIGESTMTDGDGRFRLALPHPGPWLLAAASARLMPEDVAQVEVPSDGTPAQATLRLIEPAPLEGRVVWSTGEPAVGFTVFALTGFDRQQPRVEEVAGLPAYDPISVTDADGRFVIESLHPSLRYRVSASDEDGAEAKPANTKPGRFVELTVDASTAGLGSIVGTVRSSATQAPITDFLVSLTTSPDHETSYRTDESWCHVKSAEGSFRFDGERRRRVFVRVLAPGHCLATVGPLAPSLEGETVMVELGQPAQLVVLVEDHGGRPAPGATVLLMPSPREAFSTFALAALSATADSAGRCTWSDLIPGTYLAQALDDGRCSEVEEIDVSSAGLSQGVVALGRRGQTGSVLVTVRDRTGAAQSGSNVKLVSFGDDDIPSGYRWLSQDALTDDAGVARFPIAPEGLYVAHGLVSGVPTFSKAIVVQRNDIAQAELQRGID